MRSPAACDSKMGDCTRAHCIVCDAHAIADNLCSEECIAAYRRISDMLKPWDGGYTVGFLGDWQGYDYDHQVTKKAAIDRACEYAHKWGKFTNVTDRPEPGFRDWLSLKIEQMSRGEFEQVDLIVDQMHFLIRRGKR